MMETANFPIPQSLEEGKALFGQFENFLPEDKRQIVWDTLADIEKNGGIRDEAHGKELLSHLLAALGLGQM